jgi:hypothetical protein
VWCAALFEIIKHHIRRADQLLIAAHVVGTPNEIARVTLRHIANGRTLVAAKREDGSAGFAQRRSPIVGGKRRKAPLYWASW